MGDIGFLLKLALAMILIASGGLACSIILSKNYTPGKGSIVGVTPNTTAIQGFNTTYGSKENATYIAPENATIYIAPENATIYNAPANATQVIIPFAPNATKNSTDDWEKAKDHETLHDDDGDGAFPDWALGLTCGLSVPAFFACIFCVICVREKVRSWCEEKQVQEISDLESGKEPVAANQTETYSPNSTIQNGCESA